MGFVDILCAASAAEPHTLFICTVHIRRIGCIENLKDRISALCANVTFGMHTLILVHI